MRIRNELERKAAMHRIHELEPGDWIMDIKPFEKNRTDAQNRLSFKWYTEWGKSTGYGTEHHRNYCKLHFGVPILRRDRPEFADTYDRIIKPLSYEKKLDVMEFIDITSIMGVRQMTEYLNEIEQAAAIEGIKLTHPEDLYDEAMGLRRGNIT